MKRWFTNNLGLKLLALLLAIITWIYVNNELIKSI
jgi:YbbR domain-containing protein